MASNEAGNQILLDVQRLSNGRQCRLQTPIYTETASLRILREVSESQSSGARFILNFRVSSGSAY